MTSDDVLRQALEWVEQQYEDDEIGGLPEWAILARFLFGEKKED